MARPTGVTIIAVLYFILAGFCVLGGVLMFVGGGFLASMMNQQGAGGSAGAGILAGLGAVAGVIVLIIAAIFALVGFGLWELKNWGRILALVFAGLGIFGALVMLLAFSPLLPFCFLFRCVIIGPISR